MFSISLSLLVLSVHAIEPQDDTTEEQTDAATEVHRQARFNRSRMNNQTSRPPKVLRYVQYLITKYDRDRDGKLQKVEWQAMSGRPEKIDRDGDDVISRQELSAWIVDYGQRKQIGIPSSLETEVSVDAQSQLDADEDMVISSERTPRERRRDQKFFVPANRLPSGLPDWFVARDQDGDGQLTVGEFSKSGRAAELDEFASYDTNGDGVMTAKECVGRTSERTATREKVSSEPSGTTVEQTPVVKPGRNRRKPQAAN